MAARILRVLVAFGALSLGTGQAQETRVLTTARELRALSADEAKLSHPVQLTATVTLVEPGRTVFIRDATGATFIRGDDKGFKTGQRIEVVGETFPGLYVTGIVSKEITILSEGEPPTPLALNYEQLASGQHHYDWVEVRGIIRSASAAPAYPVLKLALGDGSLDIFPVTAEGLEPERYVDATVKVVGLAAGFINDRRQLVAPHLRLRSISDITILEPPPAEPFEIPATPTSELLRFSPDGRAGHRLKVRGIVTHHEPGTAVYLRDEEQGLRVRTTTAEQLFPPGEVVEALGFPVMGRLSAELEDATLRSTGERTDVVPVNASAKTLLTGQHDADLVQIDGTVRDVVRDPDRWTLIIEADEIVFAAILRAQSFDTAIPEPHSRLRLTGVCRVSETTQPARGFNTRARAFELLLRSPSTDIRVLQRPPWWTAERLSIAASILLGIALLTLAWGLLLRQQVRRQTILIRRQVEAAAVADERQRIAREFHDTLEQELVGISLRLDAAAARAPESRFRQLLAETQRLIQQLQAGARAFVWNLRDSSLAQQPLANAITASVANVAAGRDLKIRTSGEPRRIPEQIAHDLLRIAQEATANAVKHGNAQQIDIEIAFERDHVRLTISDNGSGFDPTGPVPSGHFGLMGIRERMQKLGGDFRIESTPGSGTSLAVSAPLGQSY